MQFLPCFVCDRSDPDEFSLHIAQPDHPHTNIIPMLFRIGPGTLAIAPIFVVIGSNHVASPSALAVIAPGTLAITPISFVIGSNHLRVFPILM